MSMRQWTTCPTCKGLGKVDGATCPECDGHFCSEAEEADAYKSRPADT